MDTHGQGEEQVAGEEGLHVCRWSKPKTVEEQDDRSLELCDELQSVRTLSAAKWSNGTCSERTPATGVSISGKVEIGRGFDLRQRCFTGSPHQQNMGDGQTNTKLRSGKNAMDTDAQNPKSEHEGTDDPGDGSTP